ncbi:hypothetical protein AK812_SmicGene40192 [Symbiodinium microadriaticum]|uniref:Uncharacterized protein n=1 Tax=Symbiodinium microadriaticum TaxID=2951 RepID=A0A1Q9C9B3_SYMMI|nr:hypothetical protein AK812_SmicGene40192 [Symbiodinium microadriaticum]
MDMSPDREGMALRAGWEMPRKVFRWDVVLNDEWSVSDDAQDADQAPVKFWVNHWDGPGGGWEGPRQWYWTSVSVLERLAGQGVFCGV